MVMGWDREETELKTERRRKSAIVAASVPDGRRVAFVPSLMLERVDLVYARVRGRSAATFGACISRHHRKMMAAEVALRAHRASRFVAA
jgi:hypothetical protein